jgi:hypothetical protein
MKGMSKLNSKGGLSMLVLVVLIVGLMGIGCQGMGLLFGNSVALGANGTLASYYELSMEVTGGVQRLVGEQYVAKAIVDFSENRAMVIQYSSPAQHTGLVAVCLAWRDATLEETSRLDDFLATLTPVTLPWSLHVAALKSVAMVSGSPRATVIRKYLGINYEIPNCRISQVAYDNYMAGKIKVFNPAYDINAVENKDCFVLIYFITEVPYNTEINIPVLIDKVIK